MADAAESTANVDPRGSRGVLKNFNSFDDWMDRYRYIIDLGRTLPDFPEEWMTDEFKVRGCQSQVWVVPEHKDGRIHFHATSDARHRVWLDRDCIAHLFRPNPRRDFGDTAFLLSRVVTDEHLSPSRSNGLNSMIKGYFCPCRRRRAVGRHDQLNLFGSKALTKSLSSGSGTPLI